MFVKPAKGRAPRDPATMLRVPPEGMAVPDHHPDWQFLLRHGDVVLGDEPAAPEPAAPEPDAPEPDAPEPAEHEFAAPAAEAATAHAETEH